MFDKTGFQTGFQITISLLDSLTSVEKLLLNMMTVRCGLARFLAVLFTLTLGCAKTVGAESPPVISYGGLGDQVVGRGLAAQWSFNVHTLGPMGYQVGYLEWRTTD